MKKRLLAVFVSMCMIFSMMPAIAFATETTIPDGAVEITRQNAAEWQGFYSSENGWEPYWFPGGNYEYFEVTLNAGDTVYFDFESETTYYFDLRGDGSADARDSATTASVTANVGGTYSLSATSSAKLKAYVVYGTVAMVIDVNGNPVKECGTIAEAVATAQSHEGSTVKLLKDALVTGVRDHVAIESGAFTLDLNGFELSGESNLQIGSEAELTIVDTSSGKTGKIVSPSIYSLITSSGRLIVKSGTIECGNSCITALGGTVRIEGGNFKGGNGAIVVDRTADVAIFGGRIDAGDRNDIFIYSGGTLTLGLADGAEIGATFPGGISVDGTAIVGSAAGKTTLADILGSGVAYWQGGSVVTLADGQTEIAGGDVVIKGIPRSITVNAAENGTVTADKATATVGETITLTVNPAEGYKLDTLTVKDENGKDVTVTNNAFAMPASDVTVTGSFAVSRNDVISDPEGDKPSDVDEPSSGDKPSGGDKSDDVIAKTGDSAAWLGLAFGMVLAGAVAMFARRRIA